jgi:hypothetical protein
MIRRAATQSSAVAQSPDATQSYEVGAKEMSLNSPSMVNDIEESTHMSWTPSPSLIPGIPFSEMTKLYFKLQRCTLINGNLGKGAYGYFIDIYCMSFNYRI